jgi:cation diffusion facilitator CzcD-associated flavoprotein CzcO
MADRRFRVVVAGAGVSGLFMAETLKRAGVDFSVYEKASDVGGFFPPIKGRSRLVRRAIRSVPVGKN